MTLDELLDSLGKLRYGVPTSQKETLARSGALPGAPHDTSADQAAADRYASGYLFAQQHPTVAALMQPIVDQLKTSDLPMFGGAAPELQAYASEGVQRALLERANRDRQAQTVRQLMASR